MRLLLWSVWVVLASATIVNGAENPIVASMSWTPENGFELMKNVLANGPNVVARANFTNAINETGWSYLEIVTMPEFPDKVQVCFKVNIVCQIQLSGRKMWFRIIYQELILEPTNGDLKKKIPRITTR